MHVEWNGLNRVLNNLREFKRRLFPGVVDYAYGSAKEIRQEMSKPGELPPKYPPAWVPWVSPRQKGSFFASNGFGRGIPTKRTGEYAEAYYAIRIENGAEVGNPLSHAKFIGGKAQSPIHKGRWPIFWDVANRILDRLPERVKRQIVVIAKEAGLTVE